MQLIDDCMINANRLTVRANPAFRRKFLLDDFFVEYGEDIGLDRMDRTVALAPFILNVAPMVWFSGETYRIDALDADLAGALEATRMEVRRMYPRHRWDGRLEAARLVHSAVSARPDEDRIALLFTGGVDSSYTSLLHYPTSQNLITIWGNETALEDDEKWRLFSRHCERFANQFGHRNLFIKTNAKEIVKRKRVPPDIAVWWANVQHGMGLPGLCMPAAYSWGMATVLISSTEWYGGYAGAWGSSPEIDNHVGCAGIGTCHEGFGVTRQEKLNYIVENIRNEQLPTPALTVCSRPYVRTLNCGVCEKCLRTMTGVLVAGGRLDDFGFSLSAERVIEEVEARFRAGRYLMDEQLAHSWIAIQDSVRKSLDAEEPSGMPTHVRDYLRWISDLDVRTYCARYQRRRRWVKRAKDILSASPLLYELTTRSIARRAWFGY